jgi:hypothetical protein
MLKYWGKPMQRNNRIKLENLSILFISSNCFKYLPLRKILAVSKETTKGGIAMRDIW